MQRFTFFLLFILAVASSLSCTKSSGAPRITTPPTSFIDKDQANRMIQSYLTSIGYPAKDDEIRSWSVDAEDLRTYLSDPAIKKIRIYLAHDMDYILGGGEGQRPPAGMIVVTPILGGQDDAGKTVYRDIRMVMDNAAPCPQMCELSSALLQ